MSDLGNFRIYVPYCVFCRRVEHKTSLHKLSKSLICFQIGSCLDKFAVLLQAEPELFGYLTQFKKKYVHQMVLECRLEHKTEIVIFWNVARRDDKGPPCRKSPDFPIRAFHIQNLW
ncbi:hypothetical protein NE619_05260 [Anaerovorax odorimutans]|uniref:Uncharacterized protein n=1 Tax=Anaerovorax odorimutans TaxID=109327 RepID=A0ABT1RLS9_9FIRM|nr:hypothetical protein [Anaerovorax odorimutans]